MDYRLIIFSCEDDSLYFLKLKRGGKFSQRGNDCTSNNIFLPYDTNLYAYFLGESSTGYGMLRKMF